MPNPNLKEIREKAREEFRERFCYQFIGVVTGTKYDWRVKEMEAENIMTFLSIALTSAFSAGKKEGVEEVKEIIKGITADPFKDTDDVIDGFMLCKGKILQALSNTKQNG